MLLPRTVRSSEEPQLLASIMGAEGRRRPGRSPPGWATGEYLGTATTFPGGTWSSKPRRGLFPFTHTLGQSAKGIK